MVMPLVLVPIVQTEEIKMLEAKVDGSTDTDVADQGVHPSQGRTRL